MTRTYYRGHFSPDHRKRQNMPAARIICANCDVWWNPLLLSTYNPTTRTLPVSLYPPPVDSEIFVHFASTKLIASHSLQPWAGGTGRTRVTGRTWVTEKILAHDVFEPVPSAGSSGGPIVNRSGAPVGVILGTRREYGGLWDGELPQR
ncbi:hypothetical protein EDB19DRAFT_1822861 [Suillus lakei]|nr:hypothetical protein EDB19DRAFT_1822861 [Suillus lakei]